MVINVGKSSSKAMDGPSEIRCSRMYYQKRFCSASLHFALNIRSVAIVKKKFPLFGKKWHKKHDE